MNILVFSPLPSHPNYFGHTKRIYNLTTFFKEQGHTVHFVYYAEDGLRYADLETMQQTWDTFTFIPKPGMVYKPRQGNYAFDAWYSGEIDAYVNKIISLFAIDTLWLNYIWQSRLLESVPSHVLKVIDTHDRFTDRAAMLAERGDTDYRWFSCSKEDEGRYLDRADAVVAIQHEEADYFSTLTRKPVFTIGHVERRRFIERPADTMRRIGFIGSHNYINEKSIKEFIRVFNQHSRYKTRLELHLAGTVCSTLDDDYAFLKKRGLVENLEAFYAEMDLVINPLLFGTGLKIKSIEALSFGLPVISTAVGFEGIRSSHPMHRLETMEAMVKAIDTLAEAPARLQQLRQECRSVFDTSLEETYKAIDEVLGLYEGVSSAVDPVRIELYRELQAERLARQEERSEAYETLTQSMAELCAYSAFKQPLRKLKAYKSMLETYHFFRKQQRSSHP